ncbi:RNA polymerase sigma factor [Telmatospirillum sp. J64-1]|uniref:RNA polymerase sigma factor n=1 Tax=Telmatospirillum sp. J64-1 TaxID=2502183 RepID=UPI00115D54FA|nr:sigma-70 family RNA polymerase sigma factor [Telmatospirillum sp. J64-1]
MIDFQENEAVVTEEDFTALVSSHQKRLYQFILKNIGNPTDAEELAQQTFVEAFRALSSFRGQAELSTWLLGIAMNLVRNYLSRAPHRRYEFVSDDVLEETAGSDHGPAEAAAYSQALRQLGDELAVLPEELRQVLMLVAVDGISYDDAAAMLAIPIGTVRSRLSRARATLKERLPGVVDLIE